MHINRKWLHVFCSYFWSSYILLSLYGQHLFQLIFSQCHYWLIEFQVWVGLWCCILSIKFSAKWLWNFCLKTPLTENSLTPKSSSSYLWTTLAFTFWVLITLLLIYHVGPQNTKIIHSACHPFRYVKMIRQFYCFSGGNSLIGKSFSHVPWRFLWLSMTLKSLVLRFKSCFWRNSKIKTIVYLLHQLTWAPHLFPWSCIFHSVSKFNFQCILILSSYTHYITFLFPMLLKCVAHRICPTQKTEITEK